jgi:ribonuclease BN (tRNA processing enzyme)
VPESLGRPLTLTVVGCVGSSYDAVLQHPCSSYLVEAPQASVLLDCGFGSFASYVGIVSVSRLDAIVLSHAHRDHSADLDAFLSTASIWRDGPRVITSQETLSALVGLPRERDVDVIIVADGSRVEHAAFLLDFALTTHQMPTLAVQVSVGDARLVYSADTGPDWEPPGRFHRPDLAVIECTLETRDSNSSPFHLDAREVATLVESLDARRTIVVHVPPYADALARLGLLKRAAPARDCLLAETGQRFVTTPNAEPDR